MAEEQGFEPRDLLQSTVFKTAAFDHSASSPPQKYELPSVLQILRYLFNVRSAFLLLRGGARAVRN